MITGLAHTAICVPDVEAAVAWYRDVLGLVVLSPPYLMEGDEIAKDMGELIPGAAPEGGHRRVRRTTATACWRSSSTRAPSGDGRRDAALTDHGLTHVALLCSDIEATRGELEAKGVRFLVQGVADVARVRTTWFADPWGVVFILVEKTRPDRPYYAQWG